MIADLHTQKAASRARNISDAEHEYHEACMRTGPHLDGHILIVPSNWYNPDLSEIWRSNEFLYDRHERQWTRDTRRPHHGQRYSAAAWLACAEREYWNVWTKPLTQGCQKCLRPFLPRRRYQIHCTECEKGDPDQ